MCYSSYLLNINPSTLIIYLWKWTKYNKLMLVLIPINYRYILYFCKTILRTVILSLNILITKNSHLNKLGR